MTATMWWTIAGCSIVTIIIKAAGPVALGGRDLPPRLRNVITLMAPALLAGLVAITLFSDGRTYAVGADALGVAAAGAYLVIKRGSVLAAVGIAMAVTAAARLVG